MRQVARTIFLILDGQPVHRARAVTAWLKRRVDRIRVDRMPAYSPQLNPDEYLNRDVKSHADGGRRARDAKEMMSNVRGYLHNTQRQPERVSRHFHAEPVRYAADL